MKSNWAAGGAGQMKSAAMAGDANVADNGNSHLSERVKGMSEPEKNIMSSKLGIERRLSKRFGDRMSANRDKI